MPEGQITKDESLKGWTRRTLLLLWIGAPSTKSDCGAQREKQFSSSMIYPGGGGAVLGCFLKQHVVPSENSAAHLWLTANTLDSGQERVDAQGAEQQYAPTN